MKRSLFTVTALAAIGCGPLSTEPMPDIPETVEYDTVRIEYGEDDLVDSTPNAMSAQMLVGDPSLTAALAKGIVGGTNVIIWGQLRVIDEVLRHDPTDVDDGVWVWDNEEFKRADERFRVFRIRDAGEGTYEYQLRVGNTSDELLEVISGRFTPRPRVDGRQRGSGLLRFDFDNLHAVDPEADAPRGRAAVAFRAVGGVRQVRVATYDLIEQGKTVPTNARYDYVQLPDGDGGFRFSTTADVLKDGEPLEELAIDAVWTRSRAGRALASLTGGSLEINEVLLHECWERGGTIAFADATPDFPGDRYEDGEESACVPRLLEFDLEPPILSTPETDPAIPAPHPAEDGEDG